MAQMVYFLFIITAISSQMTLMLMLSFGEVDVNEIVSFNSIFYFYIMVVSFG